MFSKDPFVNRMMLSKGMKRAMLAMHHHSLLESKPRLSYLGWSLFSIADTCEFCWKCLFFFNKYVVPVLQEYFVPRV